MTPDDLRKRRARLALTQAELAALLGVAGTSVARWERGERAIPALLHRALRDVERTRLARRGRRRARRG